MTSNVKPEADHLRWIVEKQPSCLMRVGADGLVLAANDAALALLGAEKPSQVLGTALTGRVAPAHQESWRTFVDRVTRGSSQSLECDMHDVAGTSRSVILHAVPLLDHADGIPSLLLSARDVAAVRRVEAALLESERLRQQTAAAPPAEDPREIAALQATVKQLESDRDQLERAAGELPRLQQLLKQGRVYLQDLQTKLAAATKERDALAEQLSASDAAAQTSWAERDAAQRSLYEARERDVAALRGDLEESAAARAELTRQVTALDEHCAQLRGERDEAERRIAEHQQRIHALEQSLDQAQRDRDETAAELARRVQQHEDAMAAADEARRVDGDRRRAETEKAQQELEAARGQLQKATADNGRLENEVAELQTARQQLAADRETLQRAVSEEQSTATTLRGELERALADRAQLAAELETLERVRAQLANDLDAAETGRGKLSEELTAVDSARARLADELAAAEAARAGIAATLAGVEAARAEQGRELQSVRTRLELDVAAIAVQLNEADKALSDHRLELQSMDLAIRQIEPLAAVGRLTVEICRELLAAVGDIDARTACLTAESTTESSAREQIEQIRTDAVRAASLARQLMHAGRGAGQEEERHADSA